MTTTFTTTTQPYTIGAAATTTTIGGPLEISGSYQTTAPLYVQLSSSGSVNIVLTEDQQIAYFAAASLQGIRASGDKRDAADVAAQAYKDAVALMNAMKTVKAVTLALTEAKTPPIGVAMNTP